jgi:hypothetical protein
MVLIVENLILLCVACGKTRQRLVTRNGKSSRMHNYLLSREVHAEDIPRYFQKVNRAMSNNRGSIKQLLRAMRQDEADEQQLAGLSLSPSLDSMESSSSNSNSVPSFAGTVTSSSVSSGASISSASSTKSSIKQRWEALALHRFLSPKSSGRESLPLSRRKLAGLLRLIPHAVTTTDRHGRTPLHLACHNRYVTAPVISTLLEAPGGKHALTMRDMDGFTPLHFSCRYHPDSHIISLLVEAEPRIIAMRDNVAATPLHYACSHLTSINSNDMVSTSAPTVALLLKYDPSIALARDLSGVCPLALVCRKFDLICRHGFYGSPGKPRIVTFGSYLFLERTIPIFKAVCGWRDDAIFEKHHEDKDLDWYCSWDDVSGCSRLRSHFFIITYLLCYFASITSQPTARCLSLTYMWTEKRRCCIVHSQPSRRRP